MTSKAKLFKVQAREIREEFHNGTELKIQKNEI
jgi:hypothetical protein